MTKIILDIAEYESLKRSSYEPRERPQNAYERAIAQCTDPRDRLCRHSDGGGYYIEEYIDSEGQD